MASASSGMGTVGIMERAVQPGQAGASNISPFACEDLQQWRPLKLHIRAHVESGSEQ